MLLPSSDIYHRRLGIFWILLACFAFVQQTQFGQALVVVGSSTSSSNVRTNTVVGRRRMMESDCEDADAIAYNQYASAAVDLSNAHVSDMGLLTVQRSVRDIDNDKRRKFLYNIPLLPLSVTTMTIPPCELADTVQFRLPSPTGQKIAIFHSYPSSNKGNDNDKQQVLEIWTEYGQSLERKIYLSSKKHGKLVADATGGFGIPSWNADETLLVYTAERKTPKTISFFEKTGDDEETAQKGDEEDGNGKQKIIKGGQNTLGIGKQELWGEKYSKLAPLFDIYIVDTKTGNVGQVDNVPGPDYALGQPIFCCNNNESSIIYTAWDAGSGDEMSRRLGLVYCLQRPCKLYRSSITALVERLGSSIRQQEKEEDDSSRKSDPTYTCLTPDYRLAQSPRLSPEGKLVFLANRKGFETHYGCFGLAIIENASDNKVKPRMLVEAVWDPSRSPESAGQVAGLKFPGLFMVQLPYACFLSDDIMLATTQFGSCQKVVQISLSDGSVSLIPGGDSELSSDEFLCTTRNGNIVVSSKAPGQPAVLQLVSAVLATSKRSILSQMPPMAASQVSPADFTSSKMDFDVKIIQTAAPLVEGVEFNLPIQSILLTPNKHPSPPLLVIPHGGPHSVSSTNYLPSYAFLCGHAGYAVLLVNYRGSVGFGQASVEALPTNIGKLDLADVMAATNAVKDSGRIDPHKIGICGGSHGGFLTAHATSQYPDYFQAAVMRNPVVNIASMVTATDIPDWCYVEVCGSYHWKEYRPPTAEEMQLFYSKSPVQYLHQVRTPTLVALGLKDLRVPPSQGLEWFYALRSKKIPTKLLLYDNDDHAIDGVCSEADHWISIKRWFDSYLKQ